MQLTAEKFDALASLVERPPASADGLVALGMAPSIVDRQSADELAAEHYDVLIHDMMPVASVFLEKDSMLGGAVSRQVLSMMDSAGYGPDTSSFSADHLANELRFLGHLFSEKRSDVGGEFVRLHMAAWLPVLRSEWRRAGSDFFGAMERCLGSLISALPGDSAPSGLAPGRLIESRFDLQMEKCGLADIGRFLATTPESGIHISRKRLTELARSLRLPTGFGSRARQIEGLLRSAGQYDALNSVCDFLDREVDAMMRVWKSEAGNPSGYVATPGAVYWSEQWQAKLQETNKVVASLREAEKN